MSVEALTPKQEQLVLRMGDYRGAESVEGSHPDALMDGIAAAILDRAVELTPPDQRENNCRVALNGWVKAMDSEQPKQKGASLAETDLIELTGEMTLPSNVHLDIDGIARAVIKARGYDDPKNGFCSDTVVIDTSHIGKQSPNIAGGVNDTGEGLGAGDQGYQTSEAVLGDRVHYIPIHLMLAHELTRRQTALKMDAKKRNTDIGLLPDGKSQVVFEFQHGKFARVHSITLASAHSKQLELGQLREMLMRDVIIPVFEENGVKIAKDTMVFINNAREWNLGGPAADTGVIGKKIVVNQSPEHPVGGGAIFGKDLSKVDSLGVFLTRFASRFVVENGLARKAQITLFWTIGRHEPDAIKVKTFGNANGVTNDYIRRLLAQYIDFSVSGAIRQLRAYEMKTEPLTAGGIHGRIEYPYENPPRI